MMSLPAPPSTVSVPAATTSSNWRAQKLVLPFEVKAR
jgi:hypothetical protein